MSQTDKTDNREAKTQGRPNKLAGETSTYLLQHAYNPVDWYPWGEEAISRACAEDRPILLSIGYSSCHWCHVMAHESFEDESTAHLMNSHFINIKVDREERPDIDEIYMKFVQLLTGQGGWPMTVFLTPQLKPFFAGTYFPPVDRYGMPSFKRILQSVINSWQDERPKIEAGSEDITRQLNLFDQIEHRESVLTEDLLNRALEQLLMVFDRIWGGFGGAPKFPHTSCISLILRRMQGERQPDKRVADDYSHVVATTLDRMAWGGIHDHIGGGFARYSVDNRWLIPHFEKMLYDNALIAGNYFDAYLVTGTDYWLKVGCSTLDFVLNELTMAEGGFYCSLDADSQGVEGKYYVWTPAEIADVLENDDASFVSSVYGITCQGNFENGTSVLSLSESPRDCAARLGLSESEWWSRLQPLIERLALSRRQRPAPTRDDKMLTSWTGLMISSLVSGYRASGQAKYLDAARKAADFILDKLMQNGRLLRTYGRGKARLNAYLDDYAFTIQALLDLCACDAGSRWLINAVKLNEHVLEHFADKKDGGFFYTSDENEKLIAVTRQFYDSSTPSATSVAVMNLIRIARLLDKPELAEAALKILEMYAPYVLKAADRFASMLCALDFFLSQPVEIAVIFDSSVKADAGELLSELNRFYLPGTVTLLADCSSPDYKELAGLSPLLQNRRLHNNKAAVYICKNYVCYEPVTEPNQLGQALENLCRR